MSNSSNYERSVLDWGSLRGLARHAAENAGIAPRPAQGYLRPTGRSRWSANFQGDHEAIEVVGPHWVLHEAIEMRRNEIGTTEEEEDAWMAIVLLIDGRLQCLGVTDETKWIRGGELSIWRGIDHTARDVLEYDVTRLDFEVAWVMNSGVPGQWFGDRGRGALAYPTKGAGLAAALERVIRGDPKTATVEKTKVIQPMDKLRRKAESSRLQALKTTPSAPTNPPHLNDDGLKEVTFNLRVALFAAVTVLVVFGLGSGALLATRPLDPSASHSTLPRPPTTSAGSTKGSAQRPSTTSKATVTPPHEPHVIPNGQFISLEDLIGQRLEVAVAWSSDWYDYSNQVYPLMGENGDEVIPPKGFRYFCAMPFFENMSIKPFRYRQTQFQLELDKGQAKQVTTPINCEGGPAQPFDWVAPPETFYWRGSHLVFLIPLGSQPKSISLWVDGGSVAAVRWVG